MAGHPASAVGEVQWLHGRGGDFSEWSFVPYEESGKPCVTFLYSRGLDAEAGRDQVQATSSYRMDRTRVRAFARCRE